ncbi:MAG: hypothetical protein NXI22_03120 [bacterium]|nr:hypothetical protein [bacterium]
MQKPKPPASLGIFTQLAIAVVASLPFVLLQIWFLGDLYRWLGFLGYGGIVFVPPVAFAAWMIYALVEIGVRHGASRRLFPMFAIAGGVWLIGFFSPTLMLQPLLNEIPFVCRVGQGVQWSTSVPNARWEAPNPECDKNHEVILVLSGNGNAANHELNSGYLNWAGDGAVNLSSIRFDPISFQEGYYQEYKTGSREYLQTRLATSGMSASEAEAIATDMWQVLQQADQGRPLQSSRGDVEEVASTIADNWDLFIGGIVWIATLLVVFILISFGITPANLKLPAPNKDTEKKDAPHQGLL